MEKIIKKVAAIHDLSGFGRASLTTIIPILSTMEIQVCPVPTAVLSTQTSGFEDYSFIDLTDYMEQHIAHWKKLNLEFDCIYSGFLGSVRQMKIVADFVDYFKREDNLVVIDTVLGDDGALYDTMTDEMVSEMRKLISKADIITPNFTEAAFLLGEKYKKNISEDEIKEWLVKLSDFGPKTVVITSVPDEREKSEKTEKTVNVTAYDKEKKLFHKISAEYIPVSYPGTGDAFTSVVIGCLMNGKSLEAALEKGVSFISQCISSSCKYDYPHREGVLLERNLKFLRD